MERRMFVVLLNPETFIARTSAIRAPDGQVDGTPFWYCTEVDLSGPLLRVVPQRSTPQEPLPSKRTAEFSVFVPYSAVLAIAEGAPDETESFGFRGG